MKRDDVDELYAALADLDRAVAQAVDDLERLGSYAAIQKRMELQRKVAEARQLVAQGESAIRAERRARG